MGQSLWRAGLGLGAAALVALTAGSVAADGPIVTEQVKLTAADAASKDGFGSSVAISGDTVIVGVPGDDDAGQQTGSAYLLARDRGGAGVWGQVAKLTAAAAAAGGLFGLSVAISGDTVIVGAPADDDAGA